jgi:TRAP-type C4-dicarboxylate transport system permease small subunit
VTAFCLFLLPVAIRVTRDVHAQLGVAIEIPLSFVFASLPLALVLMAWWSLRLARRALMVRAVMVLVLAVGLVAGLLVAGMPQTGTRWP